MSRNNLRFLSVTAVLFGLCLLALPAMAFAVTDDSTQLYVGAGETYSLEGTHTYTSRVYVAAGGTLNVNRVYDGGTGRLTLIAPAAVVESGGVIAAGGAGNPYACGGTIRIVSTDATVNGTIHADATSWVPSTDHGGHGGSISLETRRSVTIGGLVRASGFGVPRYTMLHSGNGGTIYVQSPAIVFSGGSDHILANGGNSDVGLPTTWQQGDHGGAGGSVTLRYGFVTSAGAIRARGGDGGGSTHVNGIGGNGGAGGTVTFVGGERTDGLGVDVAGGAGGAATTPGTPGASGVFNDTNGSCAPWKYPPPHPTLDGVITAAEYPYAWWWRYPYWAGTGHEVRVEDDGGRLWMAFNVEANPFDSHLYVCFDPLNDGGTLPKRDDLRLDVWAGGSQECTGTGSAWSTARARSGWDYRWTTLPGNAGWRVEVAVDHAKLGIPAGGDARTVGMMFKIKSPTNAYPTTFGWPYSQTTVNPSGDNTPTAWPDLRALDGWGVPGNTPPGNWHDTSPVWNGSSTPSPSVECSDTPDGLDQNTAQYRYSKDGGKTWPYPWTAATCTGTRGSVAHERITAPSIPFNSFSTTANVVQYRISDLAGLSSTSATYTVAGDGSGPGEWQSFGPTAVSNTLVPDCTVVLRDPLSGTQWKNCWYAYSRDGGATWSGWTKMGWNGFADGDTGFHSITAGDVPFHQNSNTNTLNKIKYRAYDMVGNYGDSPVYTVQIQAPVTGLPLNGSLEVNAGDEPPSAWPYTYMSEIPPTAQSGTWGTPYVDGAAHFRGGWAMRCDQGSGVGEWYPGDSGPGTHTVETRISMAAADDFTGASQVELWMRDQYTGIVDGDGSPYYFPYLDAGIRMEFTDSVHATATAELIRRSPDSNAAMVDNAVSTAAGNDGSTWSRYVVTIPDSMDKTRLKIHLLWHTKVYVPTWYAPTDTKVVTRAWVDEIHARDTIGPNSKVTGVGSPYWRYDPGLTASWTATDNAGLTDVELWRRDDTTGGGWGIASRTATVAATTRSASGSFAQTVPTTDGRYGFYTRAHDDQATYEGAPASVDASMGIDRSSPGGWTAFSPTAWQRSSPVTCTVQVRDRWSGVGLLPVKLGSMDTGKQAVGTAHYFRPADNKHYVLAGVMDMLKTYDVTDPRAPVAAGSVTLADVVLDVATGQPEIAYVANNGAGVTAIGLHNPAAPTVEGGVATPGKTAAVCYGTVGANPFVFAATGAQNPISVIDVSTPAAPTVVGTVIEPLNGVSNDIAYDSVHGCVLRTSSAPRLDIIDVTTPAEPHVAGAVALNGSATAVVTDGSYAYVTVGSSGLAVVDLRSGPGSARIVGETDLGAGPLDISIEADRAFVALNDGSLAVVNLSDHTRPALVGTVVLHGSESIAVCDSGNYVYVSDDEGVLDVVGYGAPGYRYSTDGGAAWSEWKLATGAWIQGTDTTLTLTAPAVPLAGDSTDNRIQFRMGDQVGNLGFSSAYSVNLDGTAPGGPPVTSATHSNPASWYPNTNATMSWTAPSDPSGIAGYSIVWDDLATTVPPSTVNTTALTASRTGAAEGTHYFHVRAVDNAGNWGGATHFAYRVDVNPPTAPMAPYATPASWSKVNTFSVTWKNPSQTYAPLEHVWFKLGSVPGSWNDGTQYDITSGTSHTKSGLTVTGEGTTTAYFWLQDAAGNADKTAFERVDLFYDATPPQRPSINSTSHPDPATYYSRNRAAFTWTCSDALSGVNAYSYVLDQISDTTPDDVSEGATASYYSGTKADGTWYFHVRARDAAGNWGNTAHKTVMIDTTPPSAPTAFQADPSGWTSVNDFILSWANPLEGGSPIVALWYKIGTAPTGPTDGTRITDPTPVTGIQAPADGSLPVYAWLEDAAGNASHLNRLTDLIQLDTRPPAADFRIAHGASSVNTVAVSFDSHTMDASPMTMRFSSDASTTWTDWRDYNASVAGTLTAGEGPKTVIAQYRDSVNHITETSDTILFAQTAEITRVAGADRYAVAANLAKVPFPDYVGVEHVIVASGRDEAAADPLAAAGLSGVYRAPVLLVDGKRADHQLPSPTRSALTAMVAANPGVEITVHVVGGTASVPSWVVSKINAMAHVTCTDRVTGSDRYAVSVAIAKRMRTTLGSGYPAQALVTNGEKSAYFFNALAVSPIAACDKIPIFLTKAGAAPTSVRSAVTAYYPDCYVVGSTAAVGTGVQNTLHAKRIGSSGTRFGVATSVAGTATPSGRRLTNANIAVANKLPDALTGGSALGLLGGPLLFTDASSLNSTTRTYLQNHDIEIGRCYVLGGALSVKPATYDSIKSALGIP